MRIIHTSDWHLGQHFMGKTRVKEHRAFLDWLLELIETQKADALVVAGDVFDTGTPPSYARTLYNEFIVSLQNTGCGNTLILGGNHDSDATLNEARSILACLNTRVTAGLSENPGDHVLVMNDRQGSPGLIVCAVPFIRPRDLIKSFGGQSGKEKQTAMGRAIREFYARVFEAAADEQARLAKGDSGRELPIMATGHLTVVGGKSSESVRDIYIGSLDAFPASGFPDADYVALGHLHRAQQIKHQDHIRYSGSPIPLSFDEGHLEKQILIADFQDGALKEVTSVPVPCFRRLVCLKGNLEKIEADIKQLAGDLSDAPDILRPVWLEVEVAADDYLTDLQDRIQAMIENESRTGSEDNPALELLRVRRRRKDQTSGLVPEKKERLEELKPQEVFSRRLAGEDLDDDRVQVLNTLFDEILEQVQARNPEEAN
jgi:exonuclease SbcD